MSISATEKRAIRPTTYDFEGFANASFQTIVAEDVWLDSLVVANLGTTDATLRVTDNQGTPRGIYPNAIIPASATSSDPNGLFAAGVPVKLSGGLRIEASAADQLYVRGSYSK